MRTHELNAIRFPRDQHSVGTGTRCTIGRLMSSSHTNLMRSLIVAMCVVGTCVVGTAGAPGVTSAQDYGELARIVRHGRDFRARVRAAFALGGSPSHRSALERALRDENPAVRSAAATALARIRDRRSLRALQRARRDESVSVRLAVERTIQTIDSAPASRAARAVPPVAPSRGSAASRSGTPRSGTPRSGTPDRAVRWGTIRYVIVVGSLRDLSGHASEANLAAFRASLGDSLSRVDHVAVVPELDAEVRARVVEHELITFRLDGVIDELTIEEGSDRHVHCRISLLLVGEGESLKGRLTGAGGSGESRRGAAEQQNERLCARAVSGAVRSATADAYSALQAADVSRASESSATEMRSRRRRRRSRRSRRR